MGKVQIRYYKVRRNGRAFWEPTQAMKAYGFVSTPCGQDGPAAWAIAEELNRRWQEARRNKKPEPAAAPPVLGHLKVYKSKSLGEAFQTYRLTTEWARKAPRTREDWERGWKRIEPLFGDHPPSTVDLAIISEWREAIEKKYGLREAHRAMKIWRALWKVAAAMKYCRADEDPSLAVRNTEPKGRVETWSEGEAVRLVKRAIRMGYFGLAGALACMWDGAVSPVDARSLTLSQRRKDGHGTWFELGRAKTGRDAVLTLSRRSERLLEWYLEKTFGDAEPIGSMQIFRTRRGNKYLKNAFSEDFRDVRAVEFPGDKRMMLDFRRSGAVEAVAGGAAPAQLSAKLANSIGQSKKLEATYAPIRVAAVRQADDARKTGRTRIRKEGP
jgi:hypothetical protein